MHNKPLTFRLAMVCTAIALSWSGNAQVADPELDRLMQSAIQRELRLETLSQAQQNYTFESIVIEVPAELLEGIDLPIPVSHVRYEGAVFFNFDEYGLKSEGVQALEALAGVLVPEPESFRSILIVGHTDSTGADDYNQELSLDRANAVFETLVMLGVPPASLGQVPMGEAQPLATNNTEEGRALNRRVEFFIADFRAATEMAVQLAEYDPLFRNDHDPVGDERAVPGETTAARVPIIWGGDEEEQERIVIDVTIRPTLTDEPVNRERRPIPPLNRYRPLLP